MLFGMNVDREQTWTFGYTRFSSGNLNNGGWRANHNCVRKSLMMACKSNVAYVKQQMNDSARSDGNEFKCREY